MEINGTILPITTCWQNTTEDDDRKRDILIQTYRVFKIYQGWMTLPVALLGIIMSSIFIAAVYHAIRHRRVSRKCYVLIINRSIGDILSCFGALINVLYILSVAEPNRDIVATIDTFFFSCFWSAMISYSALSFLKLYAVAKPFHYRKVVTMKRCLYLVALSWIFFAFVLTFSSGIMALTKIEALHEWSGCRLETCLRSMYRTRNLTMIIVYVFTLVCFGFTVAYIYRARNYASSFQNHSANAESKPKLLRTRFPMWKLALNVGTFAAFNFFYVVWAGYLVINRFPCLFQYKYDIFTKHLGYIRIMLLFRIILDPTLAFMIDFRIKKSFYSIFGVNNSIQPRGSNRPIQASISEDNSSDSLDRRRVTTVETALGKSIEDRGVVRSFSRYANPNPRVEEKNISAQQHM